MIGDFGLGESVGRFWPSDLRWTAGISWGFFFAERQAVGRGKAAQRRFAKRLAGARRADGTWSAFGWLGSWGHGETNRTVFVKL